MTNENKVSIANKLMLCWMYGKTKKDMIKNENIIVEKMMNNMLRWLGM